MQDQVANLQAKGLHADYLSSSRDAASRRDIMSRLSARDAGSDGRLQLLFVTPELIQSSAGCVGAASNGRHAPLAGRFGSTRTRSAGSMLRAAWGQAAASWQLHCSPSCCPRQLPHGCSPPAAGSWASSARCTRGASWRCLLSTRPTASAAGGTTSGTPSHAAVGPPPQACAQSPPAVPAPALPQHFPRSLRCPA